MNDERMVGWPPFDLENPLDRIRIEGVSAQTVDRFGWKRNQPALPQ
jgi:hypothetical protein